MLLRLLLLNPLRNGRLARYDDWHGSRQRASKLLSNCFQIAFKLLSSDCDNKIHIESRYLEL